MIGRYQYTAAHPPLLRHVHRGVFEIAFLERGHQLYSFGSGEVHSLRGGEAVIAWPDEPHSTGDWPEFPGRLYWLQCRCPRAGCRLLGLSSGEAALLVQTLRELPRSFTAPPELRGMFEQLFATAATTSPTRPLRLRTQVLSLLLACVNAPAACGAELRRPLVDVLRWLPGQLDRRISSDELARRAGMSTSYFKALFRRLLGCPPGEFVRLMRLQRAGVALRETNEAITAIALTCGFGSSQHFAAAFRRQFRCSPQEYRRAGSHPLSSPKPLEGVGVRFHPAASDQRGQDGSILGDETSD